MNSPTTHEAWVIGAEKEIAWWRSYFTNEGLQDRNGYRDRLDADLPLQPHIAAILPDRPPETAIRILDCAAGPSTTVGKVFNDRRVDLVAVDALSDRYRDMLRDIGVTPPIPSIMCEVERLDERFEPGSFDLVYMRFALDHCYDPLRALQQMARVARDDGAVLVEHYRDSSQTEFGGLRQWDLRPQPGDLVVANATTSFSVRTEFPNHQVQVDYSPTWLTLTLRPV